MVGANGLSGNWEVCFAVCQRAPRAKVGEGKLFWKLRSISGRESELRHLAPRYLLPSLSELFPLRRVAVWENSRGEKPPSGCTNQLETLGRSEGTESSENFGPLESRRCNLSAPIEWSDNERPSSRNSPRNCVFRYRADPPAPGSDDNARRGYAWMESRKIWNVVHDEIRTGSDIC